MTTGSPLARLLSLEQRGIAMGLGTIRTLCAALDHPERDWVPVIVAGTNGKGSVAAMIDTALRAAGVRTGRYTSPHLMALDERFTVDGVGVDRHRLHDEAGELLRTIERLRAAGSLDQAPTFFEATTALAFLLFRQAGVRAAVLEVGMGGRFDATNVVTPACSVITTIDIDHTQFLGRSVAEIAFEKAGVIKSGAPAVTGETKPEALAILRRVAHERGARLIEAFTDVAVAVEMHDGIATLALSTPTSRYGPLTLSLAGRHQVDNAIVAVRALESIVIDGAKIPPSAIETGLTQTRWPGRLDRIRVTGDRWVVLDAAHNTAAAAALARFLDETYTARLPLVFSALRDKDVTAMVHALAPAVARIICVPLQAPRSIPLETLATQVRAAAPALRVTTATSPASALDAAWADSPIVCAAGSLYLIGDVMNALAETAFTDTRATRPG